MTCHYRPNPRTIAKARGFIYRPAGYQGVNEAWLCMACAAIRRKVEKLMVRHGDCKGGYAQALIRDSEYAEDTQEGFRFEH